MHLPINPNVDLQPAFVALILQEAIFLTTINKCNSIHLINKNNRSLYLFYCMKSKLQTSIAQLYKLKNQIRVQLNQIRPKEQLIYAEKPQRSAKRLFRQRCNEPTSIFSPSAEKSSRARLHSKKLFNKDWIVYTERSISRQKKHYERHYDDNVTLENTVLRKTCSYFNVKIRQSKQVQEPHNTSLSDIGMNDKSRTQTSKSRKRVYKDKLAFNTRLI